MRVIFTIAICCCATFFLSAQIVNIEDRRGAQVDTNGWFALVELGVNLVKNTNEVVTILGKTQLEYRKNRHYFLNVLNYNLVKAQGNDFVNNGYAHLRYNYELNKRLTYEAFTQAQNNEKINLQFRGLLGRGLRYHLIKYKTQGVFWGMAYMFEYNEETDPLMIFRDHRLSNYLSGNFAFTDNVILSGTTYYQPVLDDFADWRLSSKLSLLLKISSKLRFTSNFSITYDSRVPENTPHTIYSLKNGLRWNF